MPKFAFVFTVRIKVKAEDSNQAFKTAKELRAIALAAVKADNRSTAKADPVEDAIL